MRFIATFIFVFAAYFAVDAQVYPYMNQLPSHLDADTANIAVYYGNGNGSRTGRAHAISYGNFVDRIVDYFTDTTYVNAGDSLWELYRPEYDYHTIVREDDFRKMVTFIDGTSDGPQFYLKAQVRYNGVKSLWAFNSQAFQFLGTLTVEEYAEAVSKYPSVNNFSFRGCGFDTLDYVKLSLKILGECKEGRWFADFKKIPIPDSIPPKFVAAGWERVLTD